MRTRKWTKTWDPNKQSNKDKCENKSTVKEKGSEEETGKHTFRWEKQARVKEADGCVCVYVRVSDGGGRL